MKKIFTIAAAIIIALLIPILFYLWVILSSDPLSVPTAKYIAWPVACSTRSCITTKQWYQMQETFERFAEAVDQEKPTHVESLTTLVHQHLVEYAQAKANVTVSDAISYRQEILQINDETELKDAVGLSFTEYDQQVLVPLLEQESLRQQGGFTSAEQLFQNLAQKRAVIVLPIKFSWDRTNAEIVSN